MPKGTPNAAPKLEEAVEELALRNVGFRDRIFVGGQPYTSIHLDSQRDFTLEENLEERILYVSRKTPTTTFRVRVPFENVLFLADLPVSLGPAKATPVGEHEPAKATG